jgi:Fe-S cluster assembly iron-binding protein IscA
MVLDEPGEADDIFNINGFTMVVEKGLLTTTKDITVDYVSYGYGAGFRVTSEVPIGGANCGGSCSC